LPFLRRKEQHHHEEMDYCSGRRGYRLLRLEAVLMNQTASWLLLLFAGLLLVVIGFTGSLGKIIAVAFAPGILADKQQASAPAQSQSQSAGTF
jgi:hypothetical protein